VGDPVPQDMPVVSVSYAGRTWTLRRDEEMTFGRGADCAVILGPGRGSRVPRHAGVVGLDGAGPWVRNESTVRALLVAPQPGPQWSVPPRPRDGKPGPAVRLTSPCTVLVIADGVGLHVLVLEQVRPAPRSPGPLPRQH
jgi:hypothetical protein